MYCCSKKHQATKTVTLTFSRLQLLYDIGNYCWVEGDIMKVDDEHDRHPVIDVLDEGNVDRITRTLALAFDHCVELCYPYSKQPVTDHAVLDDTLQAACTYTMTLSLPLDFSQTTVNLLEKSIHELLVCTAMAEWLSITKPDTALTWHSKADTIENDIEKTLSYRRHRIRRRQSPF